jgi:hypothetical protein
MSSVSLIADRMELPQIRLIAVQGDRAGRAEHESGSGQRAMAVAGDGEALGQGLGAADGVEVGDMDAF